VNSDLFYSGTACQAVGYGVLWVHALGVLRRGTDSAWVTVRDHIHDRVNRIGGHIHDNAARTRSRIIRHLPRALRRRLVKPKSWPDTLVGQATARGYAEDQLTFTCPPDASLPEQVEVLRKVVRHLEEEQRKANARAERRKAEVDARLTHLESAADEREEYQREHQQETAVWQMVSIAFFVGGIGLQVAGSVF
jgi:hypothetical protein